MDQKYQRAFNIGCEVMNKFASTTKEYELGQKLVSWSCEQNRRIQKVELFEPPEIGSMEEKIEHEVSQPNYWLD